MSMNEVETEVDSDLDRTELLEKLNNIVRDIEDLKEQKKTQMSSFNDTIKEREAERDDILALLDKLDGKTSA